MECVGLMCEETGSKFVEDRKGMSMIVPVGDDLMSKLGGDVGSVV
jgi:hypothetical protein